MWNCREAGDGGFGREVETPCRAETAGDGRLSGVDRAAATGGREARGRHPTGETRDEHGAGRQTERRRTTPNNGIDRVK